MRTLLIAFFCVVGLVPAVQAQGNCVAPPAGLVGWWPGDGNANSIAGTNNGTLQGGATANAGGFVGQAFGFDGTNGFVQIPDSPLLRPTNLTVETWVRFSSLDSPGTAAGGDQYIIFKQNTRSSYFEGFFLGKVRGAGGDVFTVVVSSALGQSANVNSTTTIQTGVWYHVAGVRGSNFLQLYVNGQLMGQASVGFAQDYGNFPLYFGTSGQSYWDRKFSGQLDEVSLYNRALSSNEIAAISAAGTSGKCKAASGPGIMAQPQSQSVGVGSNALFAVTATGTALLSYQWRFNGSSLTNDSQFGGVDTPTLSITNAQPANAVGYSVVVTNSAGSVTSAVAVLTVLVPPAITAQPQSVTTAPGTPAIFFSASATGSAPLSYQWQLNGVNLANGTSTGVGNTWETGPSLPIPLVEMTSAWLGDKLFVTGMGDAWNPATTSPMRIFNILSNTWTILNPDRPYTGNHHAAEVFGGRLYLIGGFDANSSGKVQIYDPVANSWSLGTPAPYLAGSCASALINGKIYIAGGIVGVISGNYNGYPTNAAAVYDPALNVWTRLPPMPFTASNGMNHAASATDGNKFYVFGGRDDDHAPANGYNAVQIYDPASNTWVSSTVPGSTLSPLPQARGGMGKAVFYNGEFYVMGGETVSGSGATANHVYNRVDIYNVASNIWRLGTPMPTARHGIYPVLRGDRIYVAGGGVAAGVSYSSMLEIYVAANGGRISGATSNVLTITNVQPADAGNYTLVVSNPAGAVTSVVATLTVTASPVIESIVLSNAVVVITWSAVSGRSYRLQFTENLGSTNWSDVLPVVLAAGPTAKARDPISSSPQRFYRVILVP